MEKAIYLDLDLCVGCGACVVACMDQNDIYPEKGQNAYRRIYQVEEGSYPNATIHHVSASCMHCEDSPCIIGCPTGAITKDCKTKAVTVNKDLCIGCHSCAMACPFGVPRYDLKEKLEKCDLCSERVSAGLNPACVKVCPQRALKFDPANKVQEDREYKFAGNIVNAAYKAARK
jgi:anaerobic dimethyl sulfoxide reductase subunit B (iron-sulfur subunit)